MSAAAAAPTVLSTSQPASQSVNTRHIPTLSHSNKIEQQNSSRSSISLGERRNCLVSCLCLCLCHLSFTSHQPSDTSDTHTATDSLVSLVADNSISIIIIIGRSFVCLFAQCLFFFLLTHSLFGACLSVCSVVWCVLLWAAFHFCSHIFLFSFTVHHHHRRRCLPGTSTISNRAVALAFSLYLCPNNNNIITPTSSKPRLQKRFAPITLHKLRSLQKVVECSAIAAATTTNRY